MIVEVERTVGRFLVVKVAVVVEFGVDSYEKSVVHKLLDVYLLLGVVKVEGIAVEAVKSSALALLAAWQAAYLLKSLGVYVLIIVGVVGREVDIEHEAYVKEILLSARHFGE